MKDVPAFPGLAEMGLLFAGQPVPTNPGMSLRDWFAGQALAGTLACMVEGENPSFSDGGGGIGSHCYRLADAMLRAREKPVDVRGAGG